MKKLALTIAIVLGLGMAGIAQNEEKGLFGMGNEVFGEKGGDREGEGDGPGLVFPGHGGDDDVDAPLGTGVVLLAGLGAAYLVGKRRKE